MIMLIDLRRIENAFTYVIICFRVLPAMISNFIKYYLQENIENALSTNLGKASN